MGGGGVVCNLLSVIEIYCTITGIYNNVSGARKLRNSGAGGPLAPKFYGPSPNFTGPE